MTCSMSKELKAGDSTPEKHSNLSSRNWNILIASLVNSVSRAFIPKCDGSYFQSALKYKND